MLRAEAVGLVCMAPLILGEVPNTEAAAPKAPAADAKARLAEPTPPPVIILTS